MEKPSSTNTFGAKIRWHQLSSRIFSGSPFMNALIRSASTTNGWVPLLFLPLAVLLLSPPTMPDWLFAWLLALAIYAGCKWLTWRRAFCFSVPWQLQAAYLLGWPGMDASSFLGLHNKSTAPRPTRWEWSFAVGKTLLGVILFLGVARQIPEDLYLVRGWVGLAGLAFLLHFGSFHVLSCFWRNLGIDAKPLMNWPVLARSVADFWGRRWNTAFRDVTHRFLFQPLARKWGPRWSMVLGFGMSGLVHDLVISVPAGGGYGLPTLYFLLQGSALLFERSRVGRAWHGWLLTMLIVVGPAFVLFHPPFVRNIMLPFMKATGAL
jgi:Membrane bound O-acyl transferase family